MKLDVDFSALRACAREMDADPEASDFAIRVTLPPLVPVAAELPISVQPPLQSEVTHVDAASE